MTDTPPKRIWVQWPQPSGTGLAFSCQSRPPELRAEYILASEHAALIQSERDAWRKEPESNDAWCAGNQYALDRLCHVLGVNPGMVDWDGSDGSLNEEADNLIIRILRANDEVDGLTPEVAALIREAEDRGWNNGMLTATSIVAEERNKRNPGPLFEVLNKAVGKIEDTRFAAIRERKQ